MDFSTILDWAFERHLNPLSWYIRPIFLIFFAIFFISEVGRDRL